MILARSVFFLLHTDIFLHIFAVMMAKMFARRVRSSKLWFARMTAESLVALNTNGPNWDPVIMLSWHQVISCYYGIIISCSNMCCPRDCVSRHNGGSSGAPLKPLRVDSALRCMFWKALLDAVHARQYW